MKKMFALAVLVLLAGFSVGATLIGNNIPASNVRFVNSTSILYSVINNGTVLYATAYPINNITDVRMTPYYGANTYNYKNPPRSIGTAGYTSSEQRIYFVQSGATAMADLRYYDLASDTTSGAIISAVYGAGTGSGDYSLDVIRNETSGLLFFGLGQFTSFPGTRIFSIWSNGTVTNNNVTLSAGGMTYGDFLLKNGNLYYTQSDAVILKLNESNLSIYSTDNLAAITTGTEAGQHFFQLANTTEPYMVFSSNAAGNDELYYSPTNQTAYSVRMTTTAGNESLLSAYQSPYGTVYMIYSNQSAETFLPFNHQAFRYLFLDYFCPQSGPTLNTVCAGETGYGSGGSGSSGGNVTYPNNFTQDSLYMQVVDYGLCGDLFGNTPSQCWAYSLISQDWVAAKLIINSNFSLSNATCQATNGVDIQTLILNNPLMPNIPNADKTNVFSKDLAAWTGQLITVTCYNPYNTVQAISVPFKVMSTYPNSIPKSWSLLASSNDDQQFDDIVNLNDAVDLKTTFIVGSLSGGFCYNTLGSKTNEAADLTSRVPLGSGPSNDRYTFDYLYNTGGSGFSVLPAGYNSYKGVCGNWFTQNTYGGDYAGRSATTGEIRRLFVYDRCGGNYSNAKLTGTYLVDEHVLNYSGGIFYVGQRPQVSLDYEWTNQGDALSELPKLTCSYTIINMTGGSTDLYSGTIDNIDMSGQAGNLLSFGNNHMLLKNFAYIDLVNSTGGNLPAGNYSYDVTCTNTNERMCVNTTGTADSFDFYTGAGCAGTASDCGTTSCAACAPTTFTCENNNTVDLEGACINQYCKAPDPYNDQRYSGFLMGPQCSLYSVKASINSVTSTYACSKLSKLNFFAQVMKGNQVFNAGSDVRCSLTVKDSQILQQNYMASPAGMTWNDAEQKFERPLSQLKDSYGFNLKCGRSYTLSVNCWSSLFTVAHIDSYDFSIGTMDFCDDGTALSTCVYERTLDELDKPLYCDAQRVVINNSDVCGCTLGMKANATSHSCDGNPRGEADKKLFWQIWTWLTANWFIILVGITVITIIFGNPFVDKVATVVNMGGRKKNGE